MEKKDLQSHIIQRVNQMEAERSERLDERAMCENQYEAPILVDNEGNFLPNSPIEQNIIEMEWGRRAGLITYDIKSDAYTPNIEETEKAKYILDEFLDREFFYKEQKRADMMADIYWTRVFYCWLTAEIDTVYELNEEIEVSDNIWAEIYDTSKYTANKRVKYFMTPRALSPKDLLIDDRNLWQNDFDKCEDCIMIERLSPDTFKQRYEWNPLFDQTVVESAVPIQSENTESWKNPTRWQIILYHYYNKVCKDYWILVNKSQLLYWGIMFYAHGKLPFSVGQNYPNNGCIYWRSVPRKVRSEKWFKNDLYDNILKWARLSSSKILATSWWTTDWDIVTVPWSTSIVEFNNWIEWTKELDTRVDVRWLIEAFNIVWNEIRVNSWVDMNSPFQEQAPTLWQTEIIEENKALRNRDKDEWRDFCFDRALTFALSNIKQFAPVLLAGTKEIKDEKGKVIKKIYDRPKLTIKNVKIKKSGKTTIFEKDLWSEWYLELSPNFIQGELWVRVTTATTQNKTLMTLEKERTKEMIDNYVILSKVLWPDVEKIMTKEALGEKVKQTYWYQEKMTPTTKLAEEKKKILEKIDQVRQLINGWPTDLASMMPNENIPNWQTVPSPLWWSSPAELATMDWVPSGRTGLWRR